MDLTSGAQEIQGAELNKSHDPLNESEMALARGIDKHEESKLLTPIRKFEHMDTNGTRQHNTGNELVRKFAKSHPLGHYQIGDYRGSLTGINPDRIGQIKDACRRDSGQNRRTRDYHSFQLDTQE